MFNEDRPRRSQQQRERLASSAPGAQRGDVGEPVSHPAAMMCRTPIPGHAAWPRPCCRCFPIALSHSAASGYANACILAGSLRFGAMCLPDDQSDTTAQWIEQRPHSAAEPCIRMPSAQEPHAATLGCRFQQTAHVRRQLDLLCRSCRRGSAQLRHGAASMRRLASSPTGSSRQAPLGVGSAPPAAAQSPSHDAHGAHPS